jgi:endonuclease/exonuclease/phosphatase family metal-dependent hydrolase
MCRIVSYNIHSGVGTDKRHDYKRIGQFLASTGADIVLLQEMDTRSSLRETAQDVEDVCAENAFQLTPSPAIREANGWYGNAVLSRFKVLSQEVIDVSQSGRQPRNVQVVELQTEKGPLTVVNTHKGLKKLERRSQLTLLHNYLAKRLEKTPTPLVLAGDFNEWQFFSRAFSALNSMLVQHKVGPTFPSKFPIFSLDRVWVTKDIQVQNVTKINTKQTALMSDHLPVQIDVVLPESGC